MGTKERVEILNNKDTAINELLKRISELEFEVEKLEKNEQYKYINGQAYFRQDYVLGREKEIDRLNNIINGMEIYLNKVIETSTEQERITCSFVLQYLQELKDSDK